MVGRSRKRVGADAVIANPSLHHLFFQIFKSGFYASIVFVPGRFKGLPILLGPFEIVFGIVQQIKIQRLQVEAFQAAI